MKAPAWLPVAFAAFALCASPAKAERLVVSLSEHRVMVTSNFTGEELANLIN